MSTVAIIPARGGSKGITDKNLQPVHGVPLVTRAIRSALGAYTVDQVYVSTDSERIASVAESAGAKVIKRPAELADDQASSESAIVHALEKLPEATIVVFIQCTSPFIDPQDVDKAVRMVRDGTHDSVFSGTEDHGFRWEDTTTGFEPIGHDRNNRPRRQDLGHRVVETGAFYVFRANGLKDSGSRFHGRVGCVEVTRREALEIDSLEDLQMARELAMASEVTTTVGEVKAVVFDFDGVHTDDHVFVDQDGKESVRVKRGDGLGVGMLRDAGIPVLILSTEKNPVVSARAEKLKVDVLQGQADKAEALGKWLAKKKIEADDVVYLGNDVNDEGCLQMVGWPVVVADAHPQVKPLARIVLKSHGGEGAVRELADIVLASIPREAK